MSKPSTANIMKAAGAYEMLNQVLKVLDIGIATFEVDARIGDARVLVCAAQASLEDYIQDRLGRRFVQHMPPEAGDGTCSTQHQRGP